MGIFAGLECISIRIFVWNLCEHRRTLRQPRVLGIGPKYAVDWLNRTLDGVRGGFHGTRLLYLEYLVDAVKVLRRGQAQAVELRILGRIRRGLIT